MSTVPVSSTVKNVTTATATFTVAGGSTVVPVGGPVRPLGPAVVKPAPEAGTNLNIELKPTPA